MTSSESTPTPEDLDAVRLAVENSELIDYFMAFAKQNGQLLGSGTLVSIGGTKAILTVDHVLEILPKTAEHVCLVFPTRYDNSPQAAPRLPMNVPMKYLEKKTVGRGKQESDGPDLGLVVLPGHIASRFIPSTKSYYNLTLPERRKRVMENPRSIDSGIWVLMGAPEEWIEQASPDARFERVQEQRGLMGIAGVNKEYARGGFDYLECVANYNAAYEGPNRFGGCSGGGLWHIHLSKKEHGQIVIKGRPILSGVPFWQSAIVDCKRTIRCHGRKSVYRRVIDALSG